MGANGEAGSAGTRSGVPAAARASAHDDPPSELDLEGVVARRTRLREGRFRSEAEALAIRANAGQRRLRGARPPRLGRHAAQRQPRLGDDSVLDAQAGGGGDYGESVRGALAELDVPGMRGEPGRSARQADGHNQLTCRQHALALRRGAGQQMELF